MPGDSKTEKATPKKRRDERKKGNVFLSKDAVAVATLFASFGILRLIGPDVAEQVQQFIRYCVSLTLNDIGSVQGALSELVTQGLLVLVKTAGPMLAVTAVVAVGATFAQTRLLVSWGSLKPKFNRISPLQGIKRLFSMRSVVETFKGLLKIIILLFIIYQCLTGMYAVFVRYLYADLASACGDLFKETFSMVMKIALAFMVLAGADILYQWWEYERQMKMSKQEIKEEFKQTEGDAQIKGRIKEMQRKLSQTRMMQQVPEADVVIKNPTHFAVALRYRPDKDNAPVVLARGQDELALRIVRTAEEHGVKIIENVALARSLYASTELNFEIPVALYGEVAEILAYLYRVDEEARR